jgi:P-type Mg2+ transporter
VSQAAIPTDNVDADQIAKPQPWDLKQLTRFIVFIGPCSSIFDYTTFLVMLYVFGCWNVGTVASLGHSQSLFQTGWFVESLVTQTLIIHIIRTNKLPFIQSWASWPLLMMSTVIMLIGIALPFTPVGTYLGFVPLPNLFWPFLIIAVTSYVLVTQGVKMWLLKKSWI